MQELTPWVTLGTRDRCFLRRVCMCVRLRASEFQLVLPDHASSPRRLSRVATSPSSHPLETVDDAPKVPVYSIPVRRDQANSFLQHPSAGEPPRNPPERTEEAPPECTEEEPILTARQLEAAAVC
jgi:hypothetical protein